VKRPVAILFALSLMPLASLTHAAPAPTTPAQKVGTSPAPVPNAAALAHSFAKDSTNFDNLYRLGVAYLDRDRTADALRVLEMANRRKPNDMKTLVNLGAALDASGRAAEAQEYYRKALNAAPGDSVAVCRLASSLYSQAKYPQAVDMLRDLIKKKPRSYCAYFTLGVAFADAGIYRDAIRMWQKVVELAPSSPEATSAKESIEVLQKFVQ